MCKFAHRYLDETKTKIRGAAGSKCPLVFLKIIVSSLGENVYFNNINLVRLPFLRFLGNFPSFANFPIPPKIVNFGSTLTFKSRSGHPINNPKCIDIKTAT